MTGGDRDEIARVVAYWFEMADAALASARSEHAAARDNFAVNRAYYAAFYAASAVLLKRGNRFAKHAALRSAVHRDLVKGGVLGREWGLALDRLFASRQRADYLDLFRFDADTTARLIADAGGFVVEMRRLAAAS